MTLGSPIRLDHTARYVWVRLTLDDTAAESGSSPTHISDITVTPYGLSTPGVVNDGPGEDIDTQTSRTKIDANWNGFGELSSPIVTYEWAIGTTPGGTDIQDWTDVGLATAASNESLSLAVGNPYHTSVRATNEDGFTSLPATSDGVVPMLPKPTGGGFAEAAGGKGGCGSVGLDLLLGVALLLMAHRHR